MNTDSTLVKLLIEFGKRKKRKGSKNTNNQPKVFDSLTDVINNPLKANLKSDILTTATKKIKQISLEDGILEIVMSLEKHNIPLNTILEYNNSLYSNYFKQDHAERVVLLSTLISLQEKIDPEHIKLLVFASKHHDIGRNSTSQDYSHGKASVDILKKHNILNHLNEKEQNIVYAIIEAHSELDKDIESVLHKHGITLKEFEYAKKLCCILKDAEALDKIRMFADKNFVANRMLKTQLLKTSSSKKLINFVFQLNDYYFKNN